MHQNKPVQLARHYYLNNFRVLIDFVYQHYYPILSNTESAFYTAFTALPDNCQQLYCRLLLRRGRFIRRSKIHYPEIVSTASALKQLEQSGFIKPADPAQLPEWIGLFGKSEIPPGLTSRTLQDQIANQTCDQTPAQIDNKDLLGDSPLDLLTRHEPIDQILHQDTYLIYSLLFFGNLHQDLSEFVVTDLGLRRYEPYLTTTAALPFHSREQLLAYWQYYLCSDAFEQAASDGADKLIALYRQLPVDNHNDPVLKRRLENFSNQLARQLERENATDAAIDIYSTNTRPPSRERLARLYEKQGRPEPALDLCNAIIDQPIISEELEFALLFSVKLKKKLGRKTNKVKPHKPPEISLTLAASMQSVERITALHFAKTGSCYYVENSLIVSVFGLAVWDIVFTNIPGMFYHPFQYAPADFYDADFCHRRKKAFDERIEQIRKGQLTTLVNTHFHSKKGIHNPLVNWRAINFTLLTRALNIIPAQDWLGLFEYLLRDIKNHRSGLPDLIYFPDTGGYQLLEVKGPGDQLQKHQRRWMKHFNDCNIQHAVVNVDYHRKPSLSSHRRHTVEKTQQLCLT